MNFDSNLEKHIATEGYRLVALIKKAFIPLKAEIDSQTSYMESYPIMEKIEVTDMKVIKESLSGEMMSYSLLNGDQKFSIDDTDFLQVKKLVNSIIKVKEISEVTTYKFILDQVLKWMYQAKDAKAGMDLCNYLKDSIADSIKEFDVMVPILYLSIPAQFKIGDVEFFCLSEAQIDEWAQTFLSENIDYLKSPYEDRKSILLGTVLARYRHRAEISKAKEVAMEKIYLAVDLLKITSETILYPDYPLYFDVDNRVGVNPLNNLVYIDCSIPHFLNFNDYRKIRPNEITNGTFERMDRLHLQTFAEFISKVAINNMSELENVIIRSIKSFARAISNFDKHQRIIEIFSILESLLVLSSNGPLIDTVGKYCSRLITKKVDDRRKVIKVIKDLYEVRSSMVHHAKRKAFADEDLNTLQIITNGLLYKLVLKSKRHLQMQTILDEIDDAILSAG